MSRSRNVSLRRRTLPASDTFSAAGCSRRTETTACTAGSPWPSSLRPPPSCGSVAPRSSAARIFSSLFAPRPERTRNCCASAAAWSPATVVIPSSCQILRAVFGPSPGSRVKRTTSSGTSALCFVSAWISPSSTIWTILSSIVLPIPARSFAVPSSASCATGPDVSRTRAAARRYAITRKPASPSSSRMSASSSSWAATSAFRGSAFATQAMIRRSLRATVCLPTYNEHETLGRMVRALEPLGVRVLVIDDNSPDGTGELADRLAAERDWVSVLHRERKEGLGPAYIAGFGRALADGAELVLQMDCDFSHDPADVPRLIAAVDAGADVALGSRYVDGGGIENWGLHRRLLSRGASLYTRVLLMPIQDASGGFKCFRRRVLESIELEK